MKERRMCIFDGLRDKIEDKRKNTNDISMDFVEEIASDALKIFDDDTYPTKIGGILEKAGFKIYMLSLDSKHLSGMIGVSNKYKQQFNTDRILVINEKENKGHQKFTMAHELGHYIFDYDGKGDYVDAYQTNEKYISIPKERIANRFAAALLMPKDMFEDRYN